MILQRAPEYHRHLQSDGCYIVSDAFIVNRFTNRSMLPGHVNAVYRESLREGICKPKAFIEKPLEMFRVLGLPGVEYPAGHFTPWQPPDYACSRQEVEILEFVLDNPKPGVDRWVHFVAGDGKGHVAFDPWGISRTVKEGYLRSKRVFRLPRGFSW